MKDSLLSSENAAKSNGMSFAMANNNINSMRFSQGGFKVIPRICFRPNNTNAKSENCLPNDGNYTKKYANMENCLQLSRVSLSLSSLPSQATSIEGKRQT